MLQEGEGEHRHECMAVKALPGSPFEVVEPKFFFQLLMGLLANPSSLDSGSQRLRTYIFPPNFLPATEQNPRRIPRSLHDISPRPHPRMPYTL